jgi:kinetochore protein Mis13/DSN1
MSFSTPKHEGNQINQPKRGTRKSTRSSIDKSQNEESRIHDTQLENTDLDSMELVGISVDNGTAIEVSATNESTKIALPFSDTPVINRNKELRRKTGGGRRSSLGMRGRRASSLIDNGHSAIPHHQVESNQFFKHIESEGLSEPRRMKQLLTWCGERKLGAKPSHGTDATAILTGKSFAYMNQGN